MIRYLIDTNILVRFLVKDDADQFAQVVGLFQAVADGQCEIVVTDVLIAEVAWVTTAAKFYALDRSLVADKLAVLIVQPGIRCFHNNAETLVDALVRFKQTHCGFFDCYLAALAASSDDSVASFDRDLRKFDDVKLWQPKQGG